MGAGPASFPRCPCSSGDACRQCGNKQLRLRAQKQGARFAPECVVVPLSRRCCCAVLDMAEIQAHDAHLVAVRVQGVKITAAEVVAEIAEVVAEPGNEGDTQHAPIKPLLRRLLLHLPTS
jgi:hypothetical protein